MLRKAELGEIAEVIRSNLYRRSYLGGKLVGVLNAKRNRLGVVIGIQAREGVVKTAYLRMLSPNFGEFSFAPKELRRPHVYTVPATIDGDTSPDNPKS